MLTCIGLSYSYPMINSISLYMNTIYGSCIQLVQFIFLLYRNLHLNIFIIVYLHLLKLNTRKFGPDKLGPGKLEPLLKKILTSLK